MRVKKSLVYDYVENKLSKDRYAHVLRVIEKAISLAKIHDVDVEKAEIAALLHDVAKEIPKLQLSGMLKISTEADYVKHHHNIWHAPAGKLIAEHTMGVLDLDILNAIKYHTTGRAGMSLLEQVIFVADYIEDGRAHDGVEAVRLCSTDLDKATFVTLTQTIAKLETADASIHPDTLDAFAYYKDKAQHKGEEKK